MSPLRPGRGGPGARRRARQGVQRVQPHLLPLRQRRRGRCAAAFGTRTGVRVSRCEQPKKRHGGGVVVAVSVNPPDGRDDVADDVDTRDPCILGVVGLPRSLLRCEVSK